PTATTSHDDTPYLPADDVGEPEVDSDSPPLRPSSIRSLPTQRSSHSRKRDPDYVPRPPNAFMIFRSELWSKEKIKATVERDHRQISRIAGQLWNQLSPAQRAPYHAKADEAKRLHAITYPNYKYTPVYRKDRGVKRKAKLDHSEKIHRCQQVARLMQRGFLGDDLEKELNKPVTAGSDDYESDESDEYVEGPRRKKARKSSAKVMAPPRSRPPRLAKAHVKYEPDHDQDSISPALYDMPPTSSNVEVDGFVATADIPEFSLGAPAYNREVRTPP
ncbi:HMG-box, partial [Lentinus tigrinus ALCF2SS1-6]